MKESKANRKIEKARKRGKRDSLKLKRAERYFPCTEQGLTSAQVREREEEGLVNKKTATSGKSYPRIFAENIFNFCNTVTIALMILLIAIGAWDYAISSCIILINIAIGIYQEIKAKRTVDRLSLVGKSVCDVVRDGKRGQIPTQELVFEDVYYVNAGAQVPADSTVRAGEIEVDESILTGESKPVRKSAGDKVLAGSSVHSGEACCIADRVGQDRYIEGVARIAKKVSKPKSKIFSVLDSLIKGISVILVILAVFMLIAERTAVGGPWRETIINVSSSILGMIPIGMFLLTSTALAASVLKLSKKHALAQDLYGIEMLASADTLLLDKTGTITDGKLELVETMAVNEEISAPVLLNTIMKETKDSKSTAMALLIGAGEAECLPVSDVMSFNSARKYSAVTLEGGKTYVLGAPDFVGDPDGEIAEFIAACSARGRRTIMLSSFDGPIDGIDRFATKPCYVFALEDTLRPNVKATLDWFYESEVDIKIISGDDPVTVGNIAAKAGIRNAGSTFNCNGASDADIRDSVEKTAVFGRISPEQKCAVVKALQEKGHTVAMIGDGVNDVQALKQADCSISFAGANEVARNISRIVLMDNNFLTLPGIVQEGRQVIGNVEKVSSLYVMKNIFVMFMTLLFSIVTIVTGRSSYPFDTKKMLLIEFFVIGVPTFLFALQPTKARPKGDFMRNILKSALPAAVSLIAAAGFMLILTSQTGAAGGFEGEATAATYALTMAGFVALTVISMPPDKFRLGIIAAMFALSLLAAYVDGNFLDGTFFAMSTLPAEFIGYIAAAAAIGLAVLLISKKIADVIDAKYGDALQKKANEIYDGFSSGVAKIYGRKKETEDREDEDRGDEE